MTAFSSALVTGATGFIGAHLVRRLVDLGMDVTCLLRREPTSQEQHGALAGTRLVIAESPDWLQHSKTFSSMSADVVFHLAAAGVLPGKDQPEATIDRNVSLMTGLLRAVSQWPLKKFIYTGSCSEYGPSESTPLTEDSPLLPNSVYGASKAAAFLCGRALSIQNGVPFCNLRLFGVYGPGEASQRLTAYLIRQLSRGQPVELTGGEQQRDFLFVDDVVDALVCAAELPAGTEPDTLNVCSAILTSVREMVLEIARQLNASPDLLLWRAKPYRADESMFIVGSSRRILEQTSWRPKTSLARGISATIAAFHEHSALHPAA